MQLNPYLNFNGQAKDAFNFYERVLGGKIVFQMTWGEMPGADQLPKELHSRIMHTTMNIGGQTLMGADSPPELYQKPTGMNVSLHFKDPAEGRRVFDQLAEKGTVQMPF